MLNIKKNFLIEDIDQKALTILRRAMPHSAKTEGAVLRVALRILWANEFPDAPYPQDGQDVVMSITVTAPPPE